MTFDSLPAESATPNVSVDGVALSFGNLMTIAVGSNLHGFGGVAGSNAVVASDTGNFNGNFLTALGYSMAMYRPANFTRTINFSADVSNISMYLADVDAGQGITVNLFGASNNLLASSQFAANPSNDSRAILADFNGVAGIRMVTLVGNDPIGIDNLSFTAAQALTTVPEPTTVWLTGLALVAAGATRQRTSIRSRKNA